MVVATHKTFWQQGPYTDDYGTVYSGRHTVRPSTSHEGHNTGNPSTSHGNAALEHPLDQAMLQAKGVVHDQDQSQVWDGMLTGPLNN